MQKTPESVTYDEAVGLALMAGACMAAEFGPRADAAAMDTAEAALRFCIESLRFQPHRAHMREISGMWSRGEWRIAGDTLTGGSQEEPAGAETETEACEAPEEPEAPEPQESRAVLLAVQEKDEPRQRESRPASSEAAVEPYHGFVYLRCEHCGNERAFCAREPITRYRCQTCGQTSDLPPATKAITQCECGKRSTYQTNISDWCFDIPCVACGSPNGVEWNAGTDGYDPIGTRGRRRKKAR